MSEVDPLDTLQQTIDGVLQWLHTVPGVNNALRYIISSFQSDPWRLFLEFVLLIIMFRSLFGKSYRPTERRVKLSKKEIKEIIDDWEPEPLVPKLSPLNVRDLESQTVIEGHNGIVVKVKGEEKVNFANYNFLNYVGDERIEKIARNCIRKYGVGSCGPPGFYGTIDVHTELEKEIAKFTGMPEAILYSFGFSTVASSIPAFAKRGDILVCDESIAFAIHKGVLISRADVHYFKHNDMEDLEKILKKVTDAHKKSKKPITRRFIVTEGLFTYTGDICPLPQIVELKKKYKFRVIVDESMSFGVLGKTGRGVAEHFNLKATDIDILTGCMANSLSAAGGFCAGVPPVVDHQRLSGVGYCFSASMPALLAASCLEGIKLLQAEPNKIEKLRENIKLVKDSLKDLKTLNLEGDDSSPVLFLRLPKREIESDNERDKDEAYFQEIVNYCLSNGILLTRPKYVLEEEVHKPRAGIRITISSGHSKEDILKLCQELKKAIDSVVRN